MENKEDLSSILKNCSVYFYGYDDEKFKEKLVCHFLIFKN